MTGRTEGGRRPLIVPLFPLPNVVLFPRAILPLHIFEERYKQMTADALAGDRRVAMALLKGGWERNYYARPAIEPVVCVGTILSHERLSNGEYNVLLQGRLRARIEREVGDRSYRLAEIRPIKEPPVLEIDLDVQRQRLTQLFTEGSASAAPAAGQFRQLLGSALPTPDVADLIAFNWLEDVAFKQALLEEPDPRQRVRRVIGAVEAACSALTAMGRGTGNSRLN